MGPPLQTSVLGRDQVVNSSAGRGKCAPDERLGLRVLGFRDVWGGVYLNWGYKYNLKWGFLVP